ncbi:NAD(P)-binding domain-containing protein [Streptomyces kunmingensis]|uniref:NAD(P)-binding domain-containing protein n=1 Tax=Streptomyces kunmingensis TaxID=68225 RepID=A0ABU6CDE0_9ACTN|nr:NAD(P)-binding domain-containing protein [Streptomyces kunmingensis]MEB3962722.1 NAD(P)-binding domain-containing protein [Streptomyces kunmingensis]
MSTTTLGVIGTGMVGLGAARRAVDAGLNVVLSNSRGPETLAGLVSELGERARAATPAEAARAGNPVIASVPLAAYERLPRAELSGKTVIDPMNYAPHSEFGVPELDSDELTSSQLVQRHLADAQVVKALHNIGPKQLLELFRPAGAPDRTALPLSGDDPDAMKEVADLLNVLGFDAVDLGPLAESWRSEPNTPLYAIPYVGQPPSGLTIMEFVAWVQQAPGVPVPVARIKELAAAAVRGPAGFRM